LYLASFYAPQLLPQKSKVIDERAKQVSDITRRVEERSHQIF